MGRGIMIEEEVIDMDWGEEGKRVGGGLEKKIEEKRSKRTRGW